MRAPVIVLTLLLMLGGLGGAAIAAGLTVGAGPRPSNSVVHTTRPAPPGSAAAEVPSGGADPTTTRGDAASAGRGPASSTKDPGLSPGARKKLCRAWSAQGGGASPGKPERDAEAMRELEKAAGGADRVEEYCRGGVPSKPAGKGPAGQAAVPTAPEEPPTAPTEPTADADAPADPPEDLREQDPVSGLPSGGVPAPQEPSSQDRRTVRDGASSRLSDQAGAQRSLL